MTKEEYKNRLSEIQEERLRLKAEERLVSQEYVESVYRELEEEGYNIGKTKVIYCDCTYFYMGITLFCNKPMMLVSKVKKDGTPSQQIIQSWKEKLQIVYE